MTAARLHLALKSSLSVTELQRNRKCYSYFAFSSLEPIAVLTLARVRGLQWCRHLAEVSARSGKLELLQWLHVRGCPWDEPEVCRRAALSGNVNKLIWLQQVTAPWSAELKSEMLLSARWNTKLSAVKWLRQRGAGWPSSFCDVTDSKATQVCWTVAVVSWSLKNGCTWGNWQCAQLQPELYNSKWRKIQARTLFAWAHMNGCPCTCDADSDSS
jgi:hypothetical protein